MGVEIERKFLLVDESWRPAVTGSTRMVQGYLPARPPLTLRARIAGEAAWLTIKGPAAKGVRPEFEYAIPVEEAEALLELFAEGRRIEKTRHLLPGPGGLTWEIDEFHGELSGKFLAELEMPRADFAFDAPGWLGKDVTNDVRFTNQQLADNGWPEGPPAGNSIG